MAYSKKILIAEDESALREVLHDRFEKSGYEVEVAKDGAEVMPMVQKIKPDIILLDLVMPKKNGFEVLAELKAHPDYKVIPVIVISNLGGDEDIKKSLTLGAVDYFVKAQHPMKEIVEKVEAILAKGV